MAENFNTTHSKSQELFLSPHNLHNSIHNPKIQVFNKFLTFQVFNKFSTINGRKILPHVYEVCQELFSSPHNLHNSPTFSQMWRKCGDFVKSIELS